MTKHFQILDTDYPAIDALPYDQRSVLLSYHRGNSYAAIADIDGIAPGTVRSRIFRARAKIIAARAAAESTNGTATSKEATP
ncbi:MAG: RNA polymerase sigma factor [Pseudomonadota bacterium]